MIVYRNLHTQDEFEQVFELEKVIWNMPGDMAVSTHTMHAVVHNGGSLVGAIDEDKGRMIGFAFGIPSFKRDRHWLWSHIAGVLAAYRGQGVGLSIKLAQREWAIANGYDLIGWTFDPLQRRNANFNMRKLGAISTTYAVNIYGAMQDGINAGLQSDRLKAAWLLDDPRVRSVAGGGTLAPVTTEYPESAFLLRYTGDTLDMRQTADAPYVFIETPYDLAALKTQSLHAAQQWQFRLRQSMQYALGAGYVVVDFVTQAERCWYVLEHRDEVVIYFD